MTERNEPDDGNLGLRKAVLTALMSQIDAMAGRTPPTEPVMVFVVARSSRLGQLFERIATEQGPGETVVCALPLDTARETLLGADPFIDRCLARTPLENMMSVVIQAFGGASLFMVTRLARSDCPS